MEKSNKFYVCKDELKKLLSEAVLVEDMSVESGSCWEIVLTNERVSELRKIIETNERVSELRKIIETNEGVSELQKIIEDCDTHSLPMNPEPRWTEVTAVFGMHPLEREDDREDDEEAPPSQHLFEEPRRTVQEIYSEYIEKTDFLTTKSRSEE